MKSGMSCNYVEQPSQIQHIGLQGADEGRQGQGEISKLTQQSGVMLISSNTS